MICLSFDFLHSLKNLFSQKCMYAKKKEKKIMTIYLQNQENLFFCLKSGQMCGRTCVVCDHLKNVRAHTLHTHVLKVFLRTCATAHRTRACATAHRTRACAHAPSQPLVMPNGYLLST